MYASSVYKPGDGKEGENEEERESTIGPFGIDKKIGTAPHIYIINSSM